MSGINKTSPKGSSGAGSGHASPNAGHASDHHASGSSHGHSAGQAHGKAHGHGQNQKHHDHATHSSQGSGQSHGANASAHGGAQGHAATGTSAPHKHGDRFEVKGATPGASHGGQTGNNIFAAHPSGLPDLNAESTRHPGKDSGKSSGEGTKDESPSV